MVAAIKQKLTSIHENVRSFLYKSGNPTKHRSCFYGGKLKYCWYHFWHIPKETKQDINLF